MAIFNTFADKEASFDMRSAISFIPISSFEEIEMSLYATVGKVGREGDSSTAFKTSFFVIVEFFGKSTKISEW